MAKVLGYHSTFRYTRRTLSPQVGDDYFDDCRASRWRRIQFRYEPLLSLVNQADNLVVDLANYPNSFFLFLMAVGVYLIRRQRRRVSAPRSEFRAWNAAIILFIASKACLFVNAVVSTCWRYIRRVGQLLLRYFEYHRYIHVR